MQCPKCGGNAFLAEEEFVQALQTDPVKIIAKAVYSCGSCTERFTRLMYESLEARGQNILPVVQAAPSDQRQFSTTSSVPIVQPTAANPYSYGQPVQRPAVRRLQNEPAEGLQFF